MENLAIRLNGTVDEHREVLSQYGEISYECELLKDFIFLKTEYSQEELSQLKFIKSARKERTGTLNV